MNASWFVFTMGVLFLLIMLLTIFWAHWLLPGYQFPALAPYRQKASSASLMTPPTLASPLQNASSTE